MSYDIIGGPHNGQVHDTREDSIVLPSMGQPFKYRFDNSRLTYFYEGYDPTREIASPQELKILLPYEQTKLALESALEHVQGNLRQLERETHAPRTLLAIKTLYASDAERIQQLLTHFTP